MTLTPVPRTHLTDVERDEIMARVRGHYVATRRDHELTERLDFILSRNHWSADEDDDDDASGQEARAVVLIAESGAGKSRAVKRALKRRFPSYGKPGSAIVSIKLSSPCTLGIVGRLILKKTGYPLSPSKNIADPLLWEMVDDHLEISPVKFLFIDEMHNLTMPANRMQAPKIRDRIKSFLNDEENPIGLILVGTPDLLPFLQADRQVMRRCRVVRFDDLTLEDAGRINAAITSIAEIAGLTVEPQSVNAIASRLIHAASYQLGLAVEMTRNAIELALSPKRNAPMLTCAIFADEYAGRTRNKAAANPFLAKNWIEIDCSRVDLKDASQPAPLEEAPPRRRGGRPPTKE